jgi:hypothetical protein
MVDSLSSQKSDVPTNQQLTSNRCSAKKEAEVKPAVYKKPA